ncbi:hypothetical protein [Halanaerobium sp. MA284_MarDTE_T2]|uniref:hypothetical protein n=2 Tax=unclassified Halanaerobium TaxID=2641197 RepID=UPI000DF2B680|nr:hypothetical protein [Halanaerobium sp. MA284_MarDTE_T2]RCW44751.1 hypothetical protein DFR78_11920 [Halanaerobium sp. MA284_MarDTE_T2]
MRDLMKIIKDILDKLPDTAYNEDDEYLEITSQLTGNEINEILNINYDELFALLKKAVTIHINTSEISGRNKSFNTITYNKEKLDTYTERLERYTDTNFEFKISIDKNKFLKKRNHNISNGKSYLFFFEDKLKSWLNDISYSELCRYFSKDNWILLLENEIDLSNSYFKILGGNNLDQLEIKSNGDTKNLSYKIEKQKENCYYSSLSNLPPDIFYFFDKSLTNDLEKWLINYFNKIVLKTIFIFIANRLEEREGKKFIVIEGYKIIKINIDKIDKLDIAADDIKIAMDLYNWIYDVKIPDRIEIVRNVITRNSSLSKTENIFEKFLNNIENIYNSSRSIFKTYIQDKMRVYFEERNNIELQIYDRIKDLDSEIKELMKVLTSNILGVVGAIITVLLSYLTRNIPVNFIKLIMVGSGIFIVFNTLYHSIYIWGNRKHIIYTYENFKDHCKSILDEDEINKITGENNDDRSIMDKKNMMFNAYFWINIFLSIIFSISLICYGINLDMLLELLKFSLQ